MLTDGDRQWLEKKFSDVRDEIKDSGSKIHKLDTRVTTLENGSPHKCAEEIQKHEDRAWTHNPKKAIGLGASIVTVWEGVRAFFHK